MLTMRFLHAAVAALIVLGAATACSSSGGGSSGGWRVSGARIRVPGNAPQCRTPAPALDSFSATPSPQPDCTSAPNLAQTQSPTPSPQASTSGQWQNFHAQAYGETSTGANAATAPPSGQGWHTIYTTYTAPPDNGVYAPMVQATQQPMPTPFTTPTPAPLPTPTALPVIAPTPTP